MEQNKDAEHVERKKGGYRTMPFIIGDDSLILYRTFLLRISYINCINNHGFYYGTRIFYCSNKKVMISNLFCVDMF